MDFFNNMDTNQQIITGIALTTLIVAIIFFFYSGKKSEPILIHVPQQPRQVAQEPPTRVLPQRSNSIGALVMFSAPFCGHCKSAAPAWAELTQNFDGYNGVKIIKVNGQENPQLCQIHGVNGFPTIKYCPQGVESPEGVVTYEGDRSVGSIAQFLQQHA